MQLRIMQLIFIEYKLAIELDGNFHADAEAKEYDAARTALLKELGINVPKILE